MKKVLILKAGGNLKPLDSDTLQFNGPSHDDGGIKTQIQGRNVEVEGGETLYQAQDGSAIVFGNMINPITGKKFKQDSKILSEKEAKINKALDYSTALVQLSNPYNQWENLKFNAGTAMMIGNKQKQQEIKQSKEHLANIQDAMLQRSDELGVDPMEFSKGSLKMKRLGTDYAYQAGSPRRPRNANPNSWEYRDGRWYKKEPTNPNVGFNNTGNEYEAVVEQAATAQGVDPTVLKRLVFQESGFNPKAKSNKNAQGIMQMLPATAKQYGITESQLRSSNPADIQAVVNAGAQHLKGLLYENGNDYTLALAAYNGGQGAINHVKKELGKKQITGDDWLTYMNDKRTKNPSSKPHAWQNETFDYVSNIMKTSANDFNTVGQNFKNRYYTPEVEEALKKYDSSFKPPDPNFTDAPTPPKRGVKRQDYDMSITPLKEYDTPTNARPLDFMQVVPELYAAATNQVEPVWMQQYNPELFENYQVSLQDSRNQNASTFRAVQQNLTDNPQALSALAAQKYEADNRVNAEEFRINQQIANEVTNKNVGLLNDAQLKNLALADTQYVRQSTAKSKTKSTNQAVLNSISSKLAQNQLENKTLQVYENLYPHFRYNEDKNMQLQKVGAPGSEYLQVGQLGGGGGGVGSSDYDTRTRSNYGANGQLKSFTKIKNSDLDTATKEVKLLKEQNQSLQYMLNSKKARVPKFNWVNP